jgi:hypothetical protein
LAFAADFLIRTNAGKRSDATIDMIAMTTNNSIKVNPNRERVGFGLSFTMLGFTGQICTESTGVTVL